MADQDRSEGVPHQDRCHAPLPAHIGAQREEVGEAWLTEALEALAAGRLPAVQLTDAPGCVLELGA